MTNVQMNEWNEIEQEWVERGSPYCTHEHIGREYIGSTHMGDEGCLNCGLWWPGYENTPRPRGGKTS